MDAKRESRPSGKRGRCILAVMLGGVVFGQFGSARAAAQTPTLRVSAQSLSLEEATTRALVMNPELRLARIDTGFAQAELIGSRLRPRPNLAAEGSSNGDLRLSVTQDLQLWGLRANRIRAAALEQERTRYTALDVARLVRREVTGTYRELLFLRERVTLLDSLSRLNQRIARAATLASEQGLGSELDSRLSFASAQQSLLDREAAAREFTIQQVQLARLLGDSLSTVYHLTDSLPTTGLPFLTALPADTTGFRLVSFGPVAAALDSLVRLGMSQRPDLRAAQLDVEAQEASVAAAQSVGKPSVSVGLIYGRSVDQVTLGGQQRGVVDNGFGLGVVVGLPLWNRNQGEVARTRFASAAALIQMARIRQLLERDVRVAVERVAITSSQVETLKRTILPSNQAALRLAEGAFERGQLNILQVLQVHHAYVESVTALLETTRALSDALAELEAAVGSPVQ